VKDPRNGIDYGGVPNSIFLCPPVYLWKHKLSPFVPYVQKKKGSLELCSYCYKKQWDDNNRKRKQTVGPVDSVVRLDSSGDRNSIPTFDATLSQGQSLGTETAPSQALTDHHNSSQNEPSVFLFDPSAPQRKEELTPLDHSMAITSPPTKEKIKWPKTADTAAWRQLNEALADTSPLFLSHSMSQTEDVDAMADAMSSAIYSTALKIFGLVPNSETPTTTSTKRRGKLNSLKEAKREARRDARRKNRNPKKIHLRIVRLHHAILKQQAKITAHKLREHNDRSFRNNAWSCLQNAVKEHSDPVRPTFTPERAKEFFTETYSDPNRSVGYDTPSWFVSPPPIKEPLR